MIRRDDAERTAAFVPPTRTSGLKSRARPRITKEPPPRTGPDVDDRPVTRGLAAYRYWDAPVTGDQTPPTRTRTGTVAGRVTLGARTMSLRAPSRRMILASREPNRTSTTSARPLPRSRTFSPLKAPPAGATELTTGGGVAPASGAATKPSVRAAKSAQIPTRISHPHVEAHPRLVGPYLRTSFGVCPRSPTREAATFAGSSAAVRRAQAGVRRRRGELPAALAAAGVTPRGRADRSRPRGGRCRPRRCTPRAGSR